MLARRRCGVLPADGQGFHVIAPTDRAPWTDDIYRSSKRLAHAAKRGLIRAGFSPADYVAGGDGLDFRADPPPSTSATSPPSSWRPATCEMRTRPES